MGDSEGLAGYEQVPVMDYKRIQSLFGIKAGFFKRVVDVFLQSAPQNLDGIENSLDESELEPLRKYSHTLKGAAGNIGGARLSAICAELEGAAREGDLERCTALAPVALSAFNELSETLQQMVEEGMERSN